MMMIMMIMMTMMMVIDTCNIQVVDTHESHVLVMSAVVLAPPSMRTLRQGRLVTNTVYIIQQNLARSRTERIVNRHSKIPGSTKRL